MGFIFKFASVVLEQVTACELYNVMHMHVQIKHTALDAMNIIHIVHVMIVILNAIIHISNSIIR